MGYLDEIGDWLAETAIDNLDKAYSILGARPGPGTDIEVYPAASPMNDTWRLVGLTPAGTAFVIKFWANTTIESNKQLSAFKRHVDEWGLTHRVIIKWEKIDD